MRTNQLLLALIVACSIAAPVETSAQGTRRTQPMTPAAAQLPIEGQAPALGGASAWLNSPPLTPGDLRGKVVVVEFLTYTCINWLRTLPYVRAWADKYKDQGLVVIGVHTPEFDFEQNLDNVRQALSELRVRFPIAIDNQYAIWNAFNNEYWPALYIVDATGRIRHHQFGEGQYEQSEEIIQQLLMEAGSGAVSHETVASTGRGLEAAADWGSLRSSENYLGYERTENFASPGGVVSYKHHVYASPEVLALNHWALSGDWTVESGAIVLNQAGGRIAYRFHARDLHLVLAPSGGQPIRFRVRLNGAPPGANHGMDLDGDGSGRVEHPRLYQLVRQSGSVTDETFEIEFLDPGVRAYAFTFG